MNNQVMNIETARGLTAIVRWTFDRIALAIDTYSERRSRRDAVRHIRTVDSRLLRDAGLQRIGAGFAVSCHESS